MRVLALMQEQCAFFEPCLINGQLTVYLMDNWRLTMENELAFFRFCNAFRLASGHKFLGKPPGQSSLANFQFLIGYIVNRHLSIFNF